MPFKKIQNDVHEWIKTTSGYFPPLEILACITEEHGELARELNNRYGSRTKKSPEDTADVANEITDMIFNLMCLANYHNIDLNEAWKKKMDKCYDRDKERYK